LSPNINASGIVVPGYHTGPDDETIVDTVSVGSEYFATIGVPVVAGRAFSADDVAARRLVAIVNEAMARRFWPGGNALGSRVHLSGRESVPHEVIGVARDHKVRSVGEDPRPYLHVPVAPTRSIGLLVRTKIPADAALAALRQALLALEPAIVFTEDVSAAQVAATTMAPTRLGAMVIGAFGALALGLATVGLYGVTAYSVSRRTREVGVRMAIGATRGQVVRMILAQGARLALIGVVLGALAAAAAGRILESLLYGVSSMDPMAYGLAAGTLLLVAGAANLAPALAAARVDPLRALRSE
jgi:putative ABC transport system permease protein